LEFYQKRLESIDTRKEDVRKKLKELDEEINKLESTIGNSIFSSSVNEVIISIEAPKPTDVVFNLSYLVKGSSWIPSYDIRVITGENKISLAYYGIIYNNTGEDWINVNLSLSTAKPSVDGNPPILKTARVSFRNNYRNDEYNYVRNVMVLNNDVSQFQGQRLHLNEQNQTTTTNDTFFEELTTDTSESITCSSFNIPREATITSDNKPHKVTISNLEFGVDFSYSVLPKLSLNAYLKANIRNSSRKKVPLLAGEINVFMDNNFVTKSKIQNIIPGESFAIFLGVDNSIKVEYLPIKKNTESTGIIKKSHSMTVVHQTIVTNNKNIPVKIVMYDQLPKSDISNIKVKLIEPIIEENNNSLSITPANNVKWKFDLAPKESISQVLKYVVDYPIDNEIEFT